MLHHEARTGNTDLKIATLVSDMIDRTADKWTMLLLEVLHEHGKQRFTLVSRQVPGIRLARRC